VRIEMMDIYYNGVIFVKKGMDAEAMGVEGGRVAFVGDLSKAKRWA